MDPLAGFYIEEIEEEPKILSDLDTVIKDEPLTKVAGIKDNCDSCNIMARFLQENAHKPDRILRAMQFQK